VVIEAVDLLLVRLREERERQVAEVGPVGEVELLRCVVPHPFQSGLHFFDDLYTRNVTLIAISHSMNDTLLSNAKQVQDLLSSLQIHPNQATSLRAEYSKAITAAHREDASHSQTLSTLEHLRLQSSDLRLHLTSLGADHTSPHADRYAQLQSDVECLRAAASHSAREVVELETRLHLARDTLARSVGDADAYRAELQDSVAGFGSYDREIADLRARNRAERAARAALGRDVDALRSAADGGRARSLAAQERLAVLRGDLSELASASVWNEEDGDKDNCWKGDGSLLSFLFTLRNPHRVPPRKSALRAERKQRAISCDSACGPQFGDCIGIYDNGNRVHFTCIGTLDDDDGVYANDTACGNFLTGALNFTVKEIEVFEIADSTALPADVEKCVNGHLFQERARGARAG
jgi:hypothetical protein